MPLLLLHLLLPCYSPPRPSSYSFSSANPPLLVASIRTHPPPLFLFQPSSLPPTPLPPLLLFFFFVLPCSLHPYFSPLGYMSFHSYSLHSFSYSTFPSTFNTHISFLLILTSQIRGSQSSVDRVRVCSLVTKYVNNMKGLQHKHEAQTTSS